MEYFDVSNIMEYFNVSNIMEYFKVSNIMEYFDVSNIMEYFDLGNRTANFLVPGEVCLPNPWQGGTQPEHRPNGTHCGRGQYQALRKTSSSGVPHHAANTLDYLILST